MLEILVGLAILLILKWFYPDKGAVGKNDSDIIPFIDHYGHRDGTEPFAKLDDDFDSSWDPDFIGDSIDEEIDDEFFR
jgi:hypothetical protein